MAHVRHPGMTLAEIILSASLLGLMMVILVGLAPASILSLRRSEQRMAAAHLAHDQMEKARASNYDDLAVPSVTTLDPIGLAGTTFLGERQVMAVDAVPTDRLKAVRVRISWKDRTSHVLSYDTIVCRKP